MMAEFPFPRPITAVEALSEHGYVVAASDLPGLVVVNGQELTMGQVRDLARSLDGTTPVIVRLP